MILPRKLSHVQDKSKVLPASRAPLGGLFARVVARFPIMGQSRRLKDAFAASGAIVLAEIVDMRSAWSQAIVGLTGLLSKKEQLRAEICCLLLELRIVCAEGLEL